MHICDLALRIDNPVLKNVNISISRGSLVMISGPVGSGKSTLLRAMLGEIPPTQGSINPASHRMAYCAQKPWLPSSSIKQAIRGMSPTRHDDDSWYQEVVEACCLNHDLEMLSDGDETHLGTGGLNLSGGQRQRVVRPTNTPLKFSTNQLIKNVLTSQALARALFAKPDLVLLDDVFSALDGETEGRVFNNLFEPQGLFRKLETTVVLITNSSELSFLRRPLRSRKKFEH